MGAYRTIQTAFETYAPVVELSQFEVGLPKTDPDGKESFEDRLHFDVCYGASSLALRYLMTEHPAKNPVRSSFKTTEIPGIIWLSNRQDTFLNNHFKQKVSFLRYKLTVAGTLEFQSGVIEITSRLVFDCAIADKGAAVALNDSDAQLLDRLVLSSVCVGVARRSVAM